MTRHYRSPSGLQIVTEPVPTKTCGIALFLKVGSAHEPQKQQGITHFLEHILFKGSSNKTSLQIAQEMDKLGSNFNAATAKEYTVFHAHVPQSSLNDALRLLIDIAFSPSFSREDVLREKQIILEEIKEDEDNPDAVAHENLLKTAWQGSPYGHSILGTPESIQKISSKQLLDYHATHYQLKNAIFAIAGDVDHQECVDFIEKELNFSNSPKQKKRANTASKLTFHSGISCQRKQTQQVHFCASFPGESFLKDSIFPYIVMDTALGNGASSRLFYRIREKKGLVYSIYSSLQAFTQGGLLTIYTSTSKNKWRQALRSVFHELARLKKNGITKRELSLAKKSLEAHWLLSLESSLNRAYKLGKEIMFFGRVIPVEENLSKLKAVTAEDVHAIAAKISASHLAFSAVGEIDPKKEELYIRQEATKWL